MITFFLFYNRTLCPEYCPWNNFFCLLYMCARELSKNCSLEINKIIWIWIRKREKMFSKQNYQVKEPKLFKAQAIPGIMWTTKFRGWARVNDSSRLSASPAKVRENVPRRLVGGADCWLLTVWDFDIFATYCSWGIRSQTWLQCVSGRVDSQKKVKVKKMKFWAEWWWTIHSVSNTGEKNISLHQY